MSNPKKADKMLDEADLLALELDDSWRSAVEDLNETFGVGDDLGLDVGAAGEDEDARRAYDTFEALDSYDKRMDERGIDTLDEE